MNSNLIPMDVTDPVDIMMMCDPEAGELMDSMEYGNLDLTYAGIKINESSDEDDEECDDHCEDSFDAIDDDSTDFLDMEADERIENAEDTDEDGELIDMIMAGLDVDDLYDDDNEDEEEEETPEEEKE